MRNHLLAHLDDMVQVAALRTDENAVAILHRMRHMADTLPTYFEVPVDEPLEGAPVYGTARVGTTDTGAAVKAVHDMQARDVAEAHALAAEEDGEAGLDENGDPIDTTGLTDKIDPPDPAKELRPNEELYQQ